MSDPSLAGGAGHAAAYVQSAYVQTATGIVLLTTPFWAELLYTVNIIAATIASLCGATVGLIGVWRLLRRPKAQP